MSRTTGVFARVEATLAWLALVALAACFAWTSLPLAWIASENGRLLTAFYTDEFYHLHMLAEAVQARSFHFGINAYGHLFFDLALLPLWLRRGPIGDHTIILTLRLVSWTFALATLVMLFGATRRFCGLLAAVIATALLALTPVFVRWSVISHPDMVQLFFITVCLYAIGRRLDRGAWGWTVAAATAAGLAFASKYAGLFILPIVWGAEFVAPIAGPRASDRAVAVSRAVAGALAPALVVAGVLFSPAFVAAHLTVDGSIAPELVGRVEHLIQQLRLLLVCGGMALGALVAWWRPIERSARLRWMAVMLVTTSVVFVAVFTTVSPDSWRGFAFAKGLIAEASFAELNDPEPTEWFRVLVGPYVLSRLLFIFVVAGAVAAVWRLRDSSQLMFEKVCLAWVLLFSAVVVAGARQRPAYYLLPILPALLVLAVTGGRAVLAWAAARVPMSARLAGGLLAVAVVFELSHDAGRTLRMRREVLTEMETSAAVQVGGMLQCRVVPAATILFDYFSYVPPTFPHAEPTWGATLALLQRLTPDVVITTQRIENLYRSGDQYIYYQSLKRDRTPYRLAATRGDVRVYVRRGSPNVLSAGGDRFDAAWSACR